MAKDILSVLKEKRLYFDGGTGTVLQGMGLPAGMSPELWNIERPDLITRLHMDYIESGSNIIKTNTFGINANKFDNYEELIRAGINCAKRAAEDHEDVFVAFDMGPCGRMLKPLGDMDFEDAVELFAKNVRIAADCGVDAILIETMNDSYETKAAVLAAKENSDLPIFVTNVYDESGKLMTGANPLAMIAMLEGLRVDALGMNCSLGPDKMCGILEEFIRHASVPIIVNPNAGLPVARDGKTVFTTDAEEFSGYMLKMAKMGASILGGCCGTTPEYIKKTIEKTNNLPYSLPDVKNETVVSSYTHGVLIGKKPLLIGERINPTGKKKFKEALKADDINYILGEAVRQEEAGAHILDVNVGLPEIDEPSVLKKATFEIQAVTNLPLQLDSADGDALDGAMRIYNGKPLVNSVNGEKEKLDRILPLVKKYGGTLIALTIDEEGIPDTALGRVAIAEKIVAEAKKYGISKKDIIVDPLVLTVSSDTANARITLDALKLLKERGLATSLGVSNISFGLPCREKINSTFFALALENGLDLAIMNPFSREMMDTYYAFNVLNNSDYVCGEYIEYANGLEQSNEAKTVASEPSGGLKYSVEKGMKNSAVNDAKELISREEPLAIINNYIVPALNYVGEQFDKKKLFLPQLLMSAEAASAAFEVVKGSMPSSEQSSGKKIVLATVKGDIHDIGKNIVKVIMESYGFTVYDLGKDVAPQKILECALENECKLVGLSALMTTTVPAMEETIKLIKESAPGTKVMVGGAVLNAEYAGMINADFYAKDAMEAVKLAEAFYA